MGPSARITATAAAALALMALVAALAPAPGAVASPGGAWDKRVYGCFCHSPSPSAEVKFDVDGFPAVYDAGTSYTISIRVTATDVNSSGGAVAGFNAEVSGGEFSVPAGWNDLVQVFGPQATHRGGGVNRTSWQLVWRAPEVASGNVTLWVRVNTVNGDGYASGADHWAGADLAAEGAGGAGPGDEVGLAGGALWLAVTAGAGIAAASVATFGVWRFRRRARGGRGAQGGGTSGEQEETRGPR